MTFLTMQQEVSDRLGAYDNTVSSDLTKIKRWLNMGQQYICGKYNWPFMLAYEIVQTVTDITTGTVSVAAGGSTLTFSSAPTVSVANRYVQFSDTSDWYQITAHTASSTSATISPAYGQSSALSAATYTIRKLLYATTTPLDSYFDMKKTVSPLVLESISPTVADFFLPLYYGTGNPVSYIMGPLNSSGNLQFSLLLPPSSVFNLLIRGVKKLSDLSADTDTSIIPGRWADSMVDMACHYGFTGLDDTRAQQELSRAEIKIADMNKTYSPGLNRRRVIGGSDDQSGFGPVYTLPSNFGTQY